MPRTLRSSRNFLSALLGLGLLALVATGCGTTDPDADRGRTLFIENCGACHTLAQAGTTATIGPDLDHTFSASREVGIGGNTIEGVVKPQVLNPRPPAGDPTVDMPAEIVTGRDLDDVASYVALYAGVPDAAPPAVDGPPGAQVFSEQGCGGCHILADAGSTGTTGPNLDEYIPGDTAEEVHTNIVAPGDAPTPGYPAGVMPDNYEELMTPEEIDDLVQYLLEVAGNGDAS